MGVIKTKVSTELNTPGVMFLRVIKSYLDNSHTAWKQEDSLKIIENAC